MVIENPKHRRNLRLYLILVWFVAAIEVLLLYDAAVHGSPWRGAIRGAAALAVVIGSYQSIRKKYELAAAEQKAMQDWTPEPVDNAVSHDPAESRSGVDEIRSSTQRSANTSGPPPAIITPSHSEQPSWKTNATYAFMALAIAFIIFELRSSDRIDSVLSGLSELMGNESPAAAIKGPPVDSGPPPMAPEEAQKFKAKADQGDAYAQFRTGVIFEFGLGGFQKDANEAVRYYKLAIDQKSWKAEYNLGLMYFNGTGGIPKDEAEAARLFKLATDANDTSAEYMLALMYHEGRGGLTKDDKEAVRLLKLSKGTGGS
ncbi:MAG: sel1 repeat family protein [Rhodospirillaceae bacterium]|nr:MAG: sel1 repeat family protein [Rhodospirillaceae bacterium]